MPWDDPAGFARRAIEVAIADLDAAPPKGWIFFDRGLVDAAVALEHVTGDPAHALCMAHRYDERVFLAPPWPEIHVEDRERRHDFATAVAEYERLVTAYGAFGYRVSILPKAGVEARADFVAGKLMTQ